MSPCLPQSLHFNANIYRHLSNNLVRILHIKQIPIITKANRCTCILISYRVLLFFSSPQMMPVQVVMEMAAATTETTQGRGRQHIEQL